MSRIEVDINDEIKNENEENDSSEEVIVLQSDLLEFLGLALTDVQKSAANHLKHLREIAEKFKDRPSVLVAHIAPFLDAIFLRFKKDPYVERVIDFFIKIATYSDNGRDWIDTITTQLIEYCLSKENAKNKAVRFRACDIIGNLLKNMAETYELEYVSVSLLFPDCKQHIFFAARICGKSSKLSYCVD